MNLKLPILLLLLCSAFVGFAQKTIKGQVRDETTKENLPGVTVSIRGTSVGTSTDGGGNFSISIPNNAKELTFSSVGYTPKLISIGNQTFLEIALVTDVTNLQEVFVNALGFKTKKIDQVLLLLVFPQKPLSQVGRQIF